jgi:hypothetical protein
MSRPVIIAAANSSYFLMTCLLMESVARFAKSCRFYALDFGLTDAERRFLRSKQALIEMPAGVPGISPGTHPYVLKTAIVKYLDAIDPASPIVWIDGDVVLGADIDRPLAGVLALMNDRQADVAACEECKIADVFAFEGLDFVPFQALLSEHGVSTDASYFNGGFVIFRSRGILEDWFALAARTPFHALIDQNLLNLLIHSRYNVAPLAEEEWNVHGRLLDEKSLKPLLKRALPKILHATSSRSGHIEVFDFSLQQDFGKSYPVRLFRNPTLRRHQTSLLGAFLAREFPHLKGGDTLWTLGLAAAAGSKLAPNDPCPCHSGRKFKQCHGRDLR